MGLDMNLVKWLTLCALTLGLLSCMKEEEETPEIPASAQEVGTAIAEAWGNTDPLTMEPGDFLAQDTERKIDNATEPFFILQEGIQVKSKTEKPDHFEYVFLYATKVEQQGAVGKESTRETPPLSVYKPDPAAASIASVKTLEKALRPMADDYSMTLGYFQVANLIYACANSEEQNKYCQENLGVDSCEIQCSNLKASEKVVPVPAAIKAQANCGGFADCSYTVKSVAFDWTIVLKKGQSVEKKKVNYSVSMSPDMPFLARMTEVCNRQLYAVQSSQVLVTTCTKQRNYQKGTP